MNIPKNAAPRTGPSPNTIPDTMLMICLSISFLMFVKAHSLQS